MPKQINLLPKVEGISEQKQNLKKRLLFVSLAAVGLTLLMEIGLLVFSVSLVQRSANLKVEIKKSEDTVKSFKETESLARLLKQKTGTIYKIQQAQFPYTSLLSSLSSLMPREGMYFTDLDAQSDGKVTLSGVAKNSAELGNFITNMIDPVKNGGYYSEATLGSVNGSAGGTYGFTMSLIYTEK